MSAPGVLPDRDECVEQAYFFRTFRERLANNQSAQEFLTRAPEELLSSTRLPMAVGFLAAEVKHTGLVSSGFAKLTHYFTPFQAFVIRQTEQEKMKFGIEAGLLVLEREAQYKAGTPTPAGLFVYQFETVTRNRLGYADGLDAVAADPIFDADWREYILVVRKQVGLVDFADLVYLRSDLYVADKRRGDREYAPPVPPLFAEKEGKIAKASRGRDPLFLFAALQRQLGYPEVPRLKAREDDKVKADALLVKLRDLDSRVRMLEAEARGTFDPTQFGTPDLLRDLPPDDAP